jgi:hypothetical protein
MVNLRQSRPGSAPGAGPALAGKRCHDRPPPSGRRLPRAPPLARLHAEGLPLVPPRLCRLSGSLRASTVTAELAVAWAQLPGDNPHRAYLGQRLGVVRGFARPESRFPHSSSGDAGVLCTTLTTGSAEGTATGSFIPSGSFRRCLAHKSRGRSRLPPPASPHWRAPRARRQRYRGQNEQVNRRPAIATLGFPIPGPEET